MLSWIYVLSVTSCVIVKALTCDQLLGLCGEPEK